MAHAFPFSPVLGSRSSSSRWTVFSPADETGFHPGPTASLAGLPACLALGQLCSIL